MLRTMMRSLLPASALAAATALLIAAPSPQEPLRPEYATEEEREQAYFEIIDHDGNGWISYREARASLGVNRPEFAIYDKDWDGRITDLEFGERYREVVELTGAFQTPKAGEGSRAVTRSPIQLLSAYDQDADRGISFGELDSLFTDYDREELDIDVVLEKLDRDGDRLLSGDELNHLSRLLAAPVLIDQPVDPSERRKDVLELFGQIEPRDDLVDAVPQPNRVPGPIPHFDRLDYDRDGFISIDDLRELQSPVQLKARAGPALATLDLNEDEVVSREEFLRSME